VIWWWDWSDNIIIQYLYVWMYVQSHGRPDGNTISTAHTEPAADEPHSQHVAQLPQQAAVPAAGHGEGGRRVQELQAWRPHTQDKSHDAVSELFFRPAYFFNDDVNKNNLILLFLSLERFTLLYFCSTGPFSDTAPGLAGAEKQHFVSRWAVFLPGRLDDFLLAKPTAWLCQEMTVFVTGVVCHVHCVFITALPLPLPLGWKAANSPQLCGHCEY